MNRLEVMPSAIGDYIFVSQVEFSDSPVTFWKVSHKENASLHFCARIEKDAVDAAETSLMFSQIGVIQQTNHPLIAKIDQVITEDKYQYVVFETEKGMPVSEYVKRFGAMGEDMAKQVFIDISDVLQYLLSQSLRFAICMTTDSVFVDEDGKIVQCYLTYEGSMLAPEYVLKNELLFQAPEWCNSAQQYHGSAQLVWMCGVFLYFVVSGKLPFEGGNNDEIKKSILTSHPVFPATVSPEMVRFATRVLTKNQLTRPSFETLYSDPWIREQVPERLRASKSKSEKKSKIHRSSEPEDLMKAVRTHSKQDHRIRLLPRKANHGSRRLTLGMKPDE